MMLPGDLHGDGRGGLVILALLCSSALIGLGVWHGVHLPAHAWHRLLIAAGQGFCGAF